MSAGNPGFVGREAELTLLREHTRSVTGAGGAVDVISGEPGIGKTTLITTFVSELEKTSTPVHVGRCVEGIAPPYWPWIEIVQSILDAVGLEAVSAHSRVRLDVLETLVPNLVSSSANGETSARMSIEEGSGKFYLYQAVFEVVRFAAEQGSIAITIEDLHWADEGTCELLSYFSREIDRIAAHIICTYRNTDVRRMTPIGAAIGEVLASSRASHLRLTGLSIEEIQTLIDRGRNHTSHDGQTGSIEEAEAIFRRTGGNTLFVRALLESGDEHISGAAPPESVQHLVGRYLSRLTSSQIDILSHAAVLGSRYPIVRLITLVGHERGTEVMDAIDAGIHLGLLNPIEQNAQLYQFRHEIVRETVLEELSLSKRVALHGKSATMLEEFNSTGDAIPAFELYYHFSQSEIVHGVEKSVHYALEAARSALENHDAETAVSVLESALSSLGSHDLALSARLYAAITNARGEVMTQTELEYRRSRRLALELALATGTTEAVRGVMEELPWPQMFPPEDLELFQEALNLLRAEPVDGDDLLVWKADASIQVSRMGDNDGIDTVADRLSDEAAEEAVRRGELEFAVDIRRKRTIVYHFAGRFEEQYAETKSMLPLFQALGDELGGRARELDALHRIKRIPEQKELVARFEPKCRAQPYHFGARMFLAKCASAYLRWADWDGFDRALAAVRSMRPAMKIIGAEWTSFRGMIERDRLTEAKSFLEGQIDDEHAGWMLATLPRYIIRTNDLDAFSMLRRVIDTTSVQDRNVRSRHMIASGVALLAWREGESLQGAIGTIDPNMIDQGWELLGYLSHLAGDDALAMDVYTEGLDVDRDYIPHVGWLMFRIAELHARTQPHVCDEWKYQALRHAEQHGLILLQRRIEELAVGASPRAKDHPAGLTDRELEVLHEIVEGKTDAEIAEALFISTKTVSNHVSNILRKTGSANRTEAAKFSAQHGLTDVSDRP